MTPSRAPCIPLHKSEKSPLQSGSPPPSAGCSMLALPENVRSKEGPQRCSCFRYPFVGLVVVSLKRGDPNMDPQNTVVLIMGSSKRYPK